MNRWRRLGRTAAVLGGAAFLLAQTAGAAKPPCCFTNPRYTGACVVEPGEGETCASVLEYLNSPQSQGKTYCGNTSVRGGWKQVECKKSGD